MSKNPELLFPDRKSSSEKARRYYDENTPGIYLSGWNRDHIHFGLFEPGECPTPGESMVESGGLARALQRMVKAVGEPAEIQARHHIVDAGCGVGGTPIYLAKTQGYRVTGVNINRMQLEIAREKTVDAMLADCVRFEYTDYSESLPFEDASINVVVNIESACHYGDRARFIHEVSRILRPGARIVAMDWMTRDGLDPKTHQKYIMPLCEPFAVHGLESWTTYGEKLKDADNLQLVKNSCNLLTGLRLSGINSPGIQKLTDQFRTLCEAWAHGSFVLERYCARKPDVSLGVGRIAGFAAHFRFRISYFI